MVKPFLVLEAGSHSKPEQKTVRPGEAVRERHVVSRFVMLPPACARAREHSGALGEHSGALGSTRGALGSTRGALGSTREHPGALWEHSGAPGGALGSTREHSGMAGEHSGALARGALWEAGADSVELESSTFQGDGAPALDSPVRLLKQAHRGSPLCASAQGR